MHKDLIFIITVVHIVSWTSSLLELSGHKYMEREVMRVTSKDLLCPCPLTQAVRACAAAEPAWGRVAPQSAPSRVALEETGTVLACNLGILDS